MNWAKALTMGTVYGVPTSAVFYMLGEMGAPYVAGVSGGVFAVIGFSSAVAIMLTNTLYEDEKE